MLQVRARDMLRNKLLRGWRQKSWTLQPIWTHHPFTTRHALYHYAPYNVQMCNWEFYPLNPIPNHTFSVAVHVKILTLNSWRGRKEKSSHRDGCYKVSFWFGHCRLTWKDKSLFGFPLHRIWSRLHTDSNLLKVKKYVLSACVQVKLQLWR